MWGLPLGAPTRSRRRTISAPSPVYTVIMAVNIVGFAVGGALYARAWRAGLIVVILTTEGPTVGATTGTTAPTLAEIGW